MRMRKPRTTLPLALVAGLLLYPAFYGSAWADDGAVDALWDDHAQTADQAGGTPAMCSVDTFKQSALVKTGAWPGIGPFKGDAPQFIDSNQNKLNVTVDKSRITRAELTVTDKPKHGLTKLQVVSDFMLESLGAPPSRISEYNAQLAKVKTRELPLSAASNPLTLTTGRYIVKIYPESAQKELGQVNFVVQVTAKEGAATAAANIAKSPDSTMRVAPTIVSPTPERQKNNQTDDSFISHTHAPAVSPPAKTAPAPTVTATPPAATTDATPEKTAPAPSIADTSLTPTKPHKKKKQKDKPASDSTPVVSTAGDLTPAPTVSTAPDITASSTKAAATTPVAVTPTTTKPATTASTSILTQPIATTPVATTTSVATTASVQTKPLAPVKTTPTPVPATQVGDLVPASTTPARSSISDWGTTPAIASANTTPSTSVHEKEMTVVPTPTAPAVAGDALKAEFMNLIMKWQQIKRVAVNKRDITELQQVLGGKALARQSDAIKWLETNKKHYDMFAKNVNIDHYNELSKDQKYAVYAMVTEASKYIDDAKNQVLKDTTETYNVNYTVEKVDDHWAITDSAIITPQPQSALKTTSNASR